MAGGFFDRSSIVAPPGEHGVAIVPLAGTVPVMTRWTSQLEAVVVAKKVGLLR